MKNKLIPWAGLALTACILGCQPNKETVNPDFPTEQPQPGVPTSVGKPIGEQVSKVIGPTGGTLTSADGTLTLTFPAGALTKETTITAQPVENTAFGAAGPGYEFGPHGTKFAKPVTLTWHYAPTDLQGSSPEALGIAFQDEKNVWLGRTNLTVNAAQRRVSAPIYHFSRYSFYENFWMEPIQKTLAPNETVQLTVFYQKNHEQYGSPGVDTTKIVTPDGLPLDPLIPPVKVLNAAEVKNWRVNGEDVTGKVASPSGYLSTGQGASVMYKAPAKVPATNPQAVSVEVIMKRKGKLILVSNLTVESPNELFINGTKIENPYVQANLMNDGYLSVALAGKPFDGTKQPGIFIQLLGNPKGTHQLSQETQSMLTMNGTDFGDVDYFGSYTPKRGAKVFGPGSITITDYDSKAQTVAGSFSATLHYYNREKEEYKSMQVSGKFRTGG